MECAQKVFKIILLIPQDEMVLKPVMLEIQQA